MEQDKEPDTWELHCRHKGQSRIVNINPQQSWGDLKKTLETIFGAPSSSQKIICRGKKVVDDQSIATTKGAKNGVKIAMIASSRDDLKNAKKKALPSIGAKPFHVGDRAIYRGEETVEVVDTHFDEPSEVYYTIRRADGSERQTISKFLTHPSSSLTEIRDSPEEKGDVPAAKGKIQRKGDDSQELKNNARSHKTDPLLMRFAVPPQDSTYVIVKLGEKSFFLPCNPERTTVGMLKSLLEPVVGVPQRVMRLVAGRLAKATDDTILSSVKIKNKARMLLLFKEGFHVARYGEEVLRKSIKEMEDSETLVVSLTKRLEHRGLDFMEGVRGIRALKENVENLDRTLQGVTVRRASASVVESLIQRLKALKEKVKNLEKTRSSFE